MMIYVSHVYRPTAAVPEEKQSIVSRLRCMD